MVAIERKGLETIRINDYAILAVEILELRYYGITAYTIINFDAVIKNHKL